MDEQLPPNLIQSESQFQAPTPEIPKPQNLSDRLMPYRWHIVIAGGIIIALLFGAYSYAKYLNQQNDNEVAKQAEDTQKKIDEIRQKRIQDLTTNGTLTGHVTIGPNCPVERPGVPCTPAPEAYAAVRIGINTTDNKQTLKVLALDSSGNYEVSLAPGKYSVGTSHNEGTLGMGADSSHVVTIEAKKTTVQNFSIDTGIR